MATLFFPLAPQGLGGGVFLEGCGNSSVAYLAFFKHGTRHGSRGHRSRDTLLWELCFLLPEADHLQTERPWFDTDWTSGTTREGLWAGDVLDVMYVVWVSEKGADTETEKRGLESGQQDERRDNRINGFIHSHIWIICRFLFSGFLLRVGRNKIGHWVTFFPSPLSSSCFLSWGENPEEIFKDKYRVFTTIRP